MLIRRHGMSFTRWSTALGLLVALAAAIGWRAELHAQLPMPATGSPFEMTGFIQSATVTDANDVFSGGTMMLNNHPVVVPRNTIFQMPARSLTWAELFKLAPYPYGPTQSGLALNDVPKPNVTFEVTVQGNRVGDTYIAGLIFIDQNSLKVHSGFINFIDYAAGELRVGGTPGNGATGTRVRINDPIGRFGRATSFDVRFTIDEDNPTVKTETAYPMCIPRTNPAIADDPLCPQGNRPLNGTPLPAPLVGVVLPPINGKSGIYESAFTMPVQPAPLAGQNIVTRATPDPWRMAPFEVGDYLNEILGPLVVDGASQYISAWGINANVGIFTTPRSVPAYVAIDTMLMGIGPNNALDVAVAQEGARRTRVEGFTTDISTTININAVDVDACTGAEADRLWATQAVDPGPPTGPVAGRWRFRPGAPLFNLKGFPFLPPTRELHAISNNAAPVLTLNGLSAGEYTAPIFDFGTPENRGIGNPKVAINFETMNFLTQGSGPYFGAGPLQTALPQGIAGGLSPFPGTFPVGLPGCATKAPTDPLNTTAVPTAVAGASRAVASGSLVTLDGSGSGYPTPTPLLTPPLAFSWTQIGGPSIGLPVPTTTRAVTFAAPFIPALSPAIGYEFALTVNNGVYAATSTVRITVNPGLVPSVVLTPAQTVLEGTAVTLDASGTTDPNVPSFPGFPPMTFAWSQTAGAPIVALSNANTSIATFNAPLVPPAQNGSNVLTFGVAIDNGAAIVTPTSAITITALPPTAGVGPDQTVLTGATVTLSGVASNPNPARTLTYQWAQTAGPTPVNFGLTATQLNASFVAPLVADGAASQTFTFTLTVDNGALSTTSVPVNVTVTSPRLAPVVPAIAPISAATGSIVTLSGAGASDPNSPALALSYTWSQTGAPTVTLVPTANPSVVTFVAPALADGAAPLTLAFRLDVTNTAGTTSGAAGVTVTSPRLAPTANAGAPQTVASGAAVTLNGSASSDPNSPTLALTAYNWSAQPGAPALVATANPAVVTFTAPTISAGLAAQSFTYSLSVANSAGLTSAAPSTVTVTVNPLPDLTAPSVAFTAPAQPILPATSAAVVNPVSFTVTAIDNVGVASVAFDEVDPVTAVVTALGVGTAVPGSTTGEFSLGALTFAVGDHNIRVTATDAAGNAAVSTITITVS